MDWAKGPFIDRIALDFGSDRTVRVTMWCVNDDERTIRIEQAGIAHLIWFARGRGFNAHSLLSSGEYRVTFSQQPCRRN